MLHRAFQCFLDGKYSNMAAISTALLDKQQKNR